MAAEAAVVAAISTMIDLAANQAFQVWTRVQNLPEEIKLIENQMRTFQSYLQDAEIQRSKSNTAAFKSKAAKDLMNRTRELVEAVEDSLGIYLQEIESHKSKGPIQCLKHAAFMLCYCSTTNKFAKKIKFFKERATSLVTDWKDSDVVATNVVDTDIDDSLDKRKRFLTRARESEIFGRDKVLEKLEEDVLTADFRHKIISVVAPRGMGKTTVAKRIYQKVKKEFDCGAVVYVSQKPSRNSESF